MKKRGILVKVFAYTAVFLIVIVCLTFGLFSQQFLSLYNTTQTQQLYTSYQTLFSRLSGKSDDEILTAARDFWSANQSFSFYIKDGGGQIVFSTPNITAEDDMGNDGRKVMMSIGSEYTLYAVSRTAVQSNYGGLIERSLLALGSMLIVGIFCAFIFARQITKPIKRLAGDTKKMAALEDVDPLPERQDEIGSLARDVHAMYDKLKETISKLEDEILRVREMEETQRYFFSAASHELKTPIAATSVLLEGMLENVGDYKDHPKYLRECVLLMDAQSKIITEILELVNLNDSKIVPNPENIKVHDTIASVLPSHQTLADANGQRITLTVPDDHIVIADKGMLKKVLSNVILNAVQNTPADGEIRIWSEPIADQYRVCILNTGTHIDKDVLAKLFDPFYRVDKARSRKTGRSGLGLTIVQKTLEAMGAEFAMENTDVGVLFWLDLPEA